MTKFRFRSPLTLLILAHLFVPSSVQAYFENLRYGYTSCQACHRQPLGGGLLTKYGRTLGAELMYQKSEARGKLGEGADPEWWAVGLDLRGLQIIRDNARETKAVFIPMQTDVLGSAEFGSLMFSLTYGTKSTNSFGERRTTTLIRQASVKWQIDDQFFVQGGKFFAPFGLPLPDHQLLIKSLVGYNQNQETRNLLLQGQGEKFHASIYGFEREPTSAGQPTKGSGGQIKLFLQNKNLLSASYQKEVATQRYGISGAFSMAFLNSMFLFEANQVVQPDFRQNVSFGRYLLEFWQGTKPYIQGETSDREQRWALGLQWLPREHVDLTFQGGQNRREGEVESQGFALIHLYWL